MNQRRSDVLRAYLRKQGKRPSLSAASADPGLAIVVVIPCYDEPDLELVLENLRRCHRPRGAVEILLVMNASEHDDEDLRHRNQLAMERVQTRWTKFDEPRFRFRAVNFPRLPARHAGVGLARKIGMDEAVARFLAVDNPRGIIASLDADCACDRDYLISLESHFNRHPNTRACTIYFEHALSGPLEEDLYSAVASYELFLRYYRHGLQYANFPYAYYTVGSCLAVRCDAYARHGGMNRRKAGEDFYFLNKLMAVGGVTENNATRVMPGVRASTRTPFGTGRALNDRLMNRYQPWLTYDPRVFRDLGELVASVDEFYAIPADRWDWRTSLSDGMKNFLIAQGIGDKHAEIRANSASRERFRKRFFQWFDAFRALKFVHYATRNAYPRLPLEQACATLLRWRGLVASAQSLPGAMEMLQLLREQDRGRATILDS